MGDSVVDVIDSCVDHLGHIQVCHRDEQDLLIVNLVPQVHKLRLCRWAKGMNLHGDSIPNTLQSVDVNCTKPILNGILARIMQLENESKGSKLVQVSDPGIVTLRSNMNQIANEWQGSVGQSGTDLVLYEMGDALKLMTEITQWLDHLEQEFPLPNGISSKLARLEADKLLKSTQEVENDALALQALKEAAKADPTLQDEINRAQQEEQGIKIGSVTGEDEAQLRTGHYIDGDATVQNGHVEALRSRIDIKNVHAKNKAMIGTGITIGKGPDLFWKRD